MGGLIPLLVRYGKTLRPGARAEWGRGAICGAAAKAWPHACLLERNPMQAYRSAALVAGLVLAAAPAAAAPTAPASAQAGPYAVEPSHTRVLFAVDHMGTSTWYGDFTHASGTLKLDPKAPGASHLEVTVPVASVSTTNTKLDEELRSAD